MGRKSNAPERRYQIIWALYDCLAEKGHEKVTVKEIAKKADLAPGVLHYYFKTKDDIVSTLAATLIEKYTEDLQACIRETQTPEQKIRVAIEFIIERLIFDLPLNRVFYNLIQMVFERPDLDVTLRGMFENYRKEVSRIFREVGAGHQSDMLGASLVAVTEGFALQHMVDPGALDRSAVSSVISKMIQDRLGMKIHTGTPV